MTTQTETQIETMTLSSTEMLKDQNGNHKPVKAISIRTPVKREGKGNLALNAEGKEMAAYGGGKMPWHGCGVTCDGLLSSAEALRLSGLDITMEKIPLSATWFDGEEYVVSPIEGLFGVKRSDEKHALPGVCIGGRYSLIQNREAFALLDKFFGEGAMLIDSCGAVDYGAKVWMLARVPSLFFKDCSDKMNTYVLFCNTHDGSGALTAQIVNMRVECRNMLIAALNGAVNRVSIRHTPGWVGATERVGGILGLAHHYEEVWFNVMEDSRKMKLDTDTFIKTYLDRTDPIIDLEKGALTRVNNKRESLIRLFRKGQGNEGQTHWDAFNAYTEFATWEQSFKETKKSSKTENTFKGIVMTDEIDMAKQALNIIVSTVALSNKTRLLLKV